MRRDLGLHAAFAGVGVLLGAGSGLWAFTAGATYTATLTAGPVVGMALLLVTGQSGLANGLVLCVLWAAWAIVAAATGGEILWPLLLLGAYAGLNPRPQLWWCAIGSLLGVIALEAVGLVTAERSTEDLWMRAVTVLGVAALALVLRNRLDRAHRALKAQTREREATLDQLRATAAAHSALAVELDKRDESFARLTHEIRTPLNGILGLAQLLGDPNLSVAPRSLAREINDAGLTLLRLLNDILDMARIRSGSFDLAPESLVLDDTIEGIIAVFAGKARAKDLDLAYVPGTNLPYSIQADPARLQQVIGNLVGNALKYTDKGWVKVTAERKGVRLVISVQDTGPGIPEAARDSIFDAYEQVGPQDQGTGLGLSLVKQIVELMGGEISFRPRSAGGSSFRVALPLVGGEKRAGSRPDTLPTRVLVVEPHESSRLAVIARCERLGISVVERHGTLDQSPLSAVGVDACLISSAWADEVGLDPSQLPRLIWLGPKRKGSPRPHVSKPIATRELTTVLSGSEEELDDGFDANLAWKYPHRILVAEDDPTNRHVLELLMERLGYAATFVGTGEAAVLAARAAPYTLAFLDRQLPGIDGIEVAGQLRKLRPDCAIALMTASIDSDQRARLDATGVTRVVMKPLSLSQLEDLLVETAERSVAKPVALPTDRAPTPTQVVRSDIDAALNQLLQLAKGKQPAVNKMAAEWMAHARKNLKLATESSSRDDIARAAHAVAGGAGLFGAHTLTHAAKALEAKAKGEGDYDAALAEFKQLCQATLRELAARGYDPA